jgi:hypothetical protein
MQAITTIGFDIAKSVFQVHGVGAAGQVVRSATAPCLAGEHPSLIRQSRDR